VRASRQQHGTIATHGRFVSHVPTSPRAADAFNFLQLAEVEVLGQSTPLPTPTPTRTPTPPGGLSGLYHYHLDHLGSTQVITQSDGTPVRYKRYTPYGEIRGGSSCGSDGFCREYTGYDTEPISGLEYANARVYDPALGMFLTEDPVHEYPNLYAYVAWDPMNRTDPTGTTIVEPFRDSPLNPANNVTYYFTFTPVGAFASVLPAQGASGGAGAGNENLAIAEGLLHDQRFGFGDTRLTGLELPDVMPVGANVGDFVEGAADLVNTFRSLQNAEGFSRLTFGARAQVAELGAPGRLFEARLDVAPGRFEPSTGIGMVGKIRGLGFPSAMPSGGQINPAAGKIWFPMRALGGGWLSPGPRFEGVIRYPSELGIPSERYLRLT